MENFSTSLLFKLHSGHDTFCSYFVHGVAALQQGAQTLLSESTYHHCHHEQDGCHAPNLVHRGAPHLGIWFTTYWYPRCWTTWRQQNASYTELHIKKGQLFWLPGPQQQYCKFNGHKDNLNGMACSYILKVQNSGKHRRWLSIGRFPKQDADQGQQNQQRMGAQQRANNVLEFP